MKGFLTPAAPGLVPTAVARSTYEDYARRYGIRLTHKRGDNLRAPKPARLLAQQIRTYEERHRPTGGLYV